MTDTLQRRYLRNKFGVDSPRYKTYMKERKAGLRLVDARTRVEEVVRGAQQRGLDMQLSRTDVELLLTGTCHYCGTEYMGNSGGSFLGIDRVDNSVRKYTQENSVSCCWPCNKMKGSMNGDEFLAHVARIRAYQSKKEVNLLE
jgi:5-methylcytosine-specific restriction endonuclease McrA